MKSKIILRFRDLITEEDGTINDHQTLISRFGEVWWGWWMKQDETPPIDIFKKMVTEIEKKGFVKSYLFNTGLLKIYEVKTYKILVAPSSNKIPTPNPEKSPSYYHRGRYPAWFLLKKIEEISFDNIELLYHSFPTRLEPDFKEYYSDYVGQKVMSLKQLKEFDVTLWVVK
ncbi:hypothetical protein KC799_11045 [candidate division KSB1 bacterium]|nr:hypothetical protein [candidate division KSB1 bacterium]